MCVGGVVVAQGFIIKLGWMSQSEGGPFSSRVNIVKSQLC